MRKASRIVLLVGAILGLFLAGLFIIATLVFFIISSSIGREIILDGLENGSIQTTFSGSIEEKADAIQLVFRVLAIFYLLISISGLIASLFSFISRNKPITSNLVLTIIFSVLSLSQVSAVGSIFALIANGLEERRKIASHNEESI